MAVSYKRGTPVDSEPQAPNPESYILHTGAAMAGGRKGLCRAPPREAELEPSPVQGYLAHKKPTPLYDPLTTLGIGLR